MPDKTAAGISDATSLKANIKTNNITPAIIPDNFVLPPALMFTTVLIVAPAPGIPPKIAAILFPIP